MVWKNWMKSMIRFLLVRDPITRKKSITCTMLVLVFLLTFAAHIFYLIRPFEHKVLYSFLFFFGLIFAAYIQKRIRISLTGVEVDGCHGERK